jgi:hypothetical protein
MRANKTLTLSARDAEVSSRSVVEAACVLLFPNSETPYRHQWPTAIPNDKL